MKFSKWISGLAASALLLSAVVVPSYAAESISLKLADAAALAIKNDTELASIEKKIAMAKTDLSMAKANASNYETKTWSSGAERQQNALKAYLLPLQKQHALDALERQKLSAEKQLNLEVTKYFQSIVKKQSDIEDKTNELKQLEANLNTKKSEFKLGKVTALDLKKLEVQKSETQKGLNTAKIDLELLYMDLNQTLGYDLAKRYSVVFDQNFGKASYTISDISALIKKNQESSDSILSQKAAIEEKDLEIKTLKNYGLSDVYNDASAQTDLRDKEVDLDKAIKSLAKTVAAIEFNIRNDYNSLLNLQSDIEMAKLDLASAKDDLALAQTKFGLGKITANELSTAKNAVSKYERSLSSLFIDYGVLVETFKKNYE